MKCFILIFFLAFTQSANAEYVSCIKNGDDSKCKVSVVGISAEDLKSPELKFTISGQTTKPEIFDNLSMYVTLGDIQQSENGGWSVNAISRPSSLELPKQIRKLSEINEEDKKYLGSGFFYQTDKVQKLTEDVMATYNFQNRLSAAVTILVKLNSLMKYDYDKFNARNAGDGIPTAEKILKAGKGLCFEFSIVFVAAARAVGIPARIVAGSQILPNRTGSHAWVEIKLNDNTWWPLEPQSTGVLLPHSGYLPYSEYRVFDADSIAEATQNYLLQRIIDKQWFDGGITLSKDQTDQSFDDQE